MNPQVLLVARWPVGGIRTYFRYVYRLFDSDAYEFTLIAPASAEADLLVDDIGRPLKSFQSCGESPIEIARAVRRACRVGNYDLVHSHGLGAAICTTGALVGLNQRNHLVTLHDVFLPSHFERFSGRLNRILVRQMLARASHLHLLGADPRDNLFEFFPHAKRKVAGKLSIIESGIEVERFATVSTGDFDIRNELGIGPEKKILGFFGRFMAQKGFAILVESVKQLLSAGQNAKVPAIVCVGSGGFVDRERRELAAAGIDDVFHFLPFVPNPAELMVQMDGIVMPSRWESVGLVAMEVLVAGVPLIASDCIGLRMVVKDTPSFQFTSGDANALTEAIQSWQSDDRRNEFSAYVDTAAERYDVRRTKSRLADLYQDLLR